MQSDSKYSRTPTPMKMGMAADGGPLLEMKKLDLLILGPSKVGKTTMMKAFSSGQTQIEEDHHIRDQVGMQITTQYHQLGASTLEHTVKLVFWDPAMAELTPE